MWVLTKILHLMKNLKQSMIRKVLEKASIIFCSKPKEAREYQLMELHLTRHQRKLIMFQIQNNQAREERNDQNKQKMLLQNQIIEEWKIHLTLQNHPI